MNLLLNSEMTLKEIKATRAHIVSIDRTSMIELRRGFKLYTFYRLMDRNTRISPDAIYKLKEIEWIIPYKSLMYIAAIIVMAVIVK
jgi:hypothetical protein